MAQIKQEIDNATNQKNDIVVEYERGVYQDNVSFIDIDSKEIIDLKMTKRDAAKATATLTRSRPEAYVIGSDQTEIINKLKTLGIEVDFLDAEKQLNVESYVIEDYYRNPFKYEKMKLQKVSVDLKNEELSFPEGTAIVYMSQKRANLIPELLEPEAPNSFVSFGVIQTNTGQTLPIHRLLK